MRPKKRQLNRRHLVKDLLFLAVVFFVLFFSLTNFVKVDESDFLFGVDSGEFKATPEAFLFGKKVTWPITVKGDVNEQIVGEYEVEYTPFLSIRKFYQTVNVVDGQNPQITLDGDCEITLRTIEEYEEQGFSATDNYDGDITENVIINVQQKERNLYEIEYSVKDSSGNFASAKRIIHLSIGTVYLTFDDGPSLDTTPALLDLLESKGVKATFFLVGFGKEKADLVKRAYEDGHTIALHGYSHEYSKIYVSPEAVLENFQRIEKLVEETLGVKSSKIIRFPGGASNTVSKNYCLGVMTEATKLVEEYGYTYFDWNVDSSDAGGADTAEEIYQNVVDGIKPGRNNVVLMHDSGGHDETLQAVEWIIDYCLENNYDLKPITEETKPVQHGIAN